MRLGVRRILARVKKWMGLWQSINGTVVTFEICTFQSTNLHFHAVASRRSICAAPPHRTRHGPACCFSPAVRNPAYCGQFCEQIFRWQRDKRYRKSFQRCRSSAKPAWPPILSLCTRKSVAPGTPRKALPIKPAHRASEEFFLVCSTVYTSCRHIQLRNHLRRDQGRSGMRFVRFYSVRSLEIYLHVIHHRKVSEANRVKGTSRLQKSPA